MDSWEIAARAASWAKPGMVLGLGTGRAASRFVREIGRRVRGGLDIRGVPTSLATEALARAEGIPLAGFDEVSGVDLAVDGADEVGPGGELIKGHGGALVRERVVAAVSRRFVVLVGPEKLSPGLGTLCAVPVEVIPFAAPLVERRLAEWGAEARLRRAKDGSPARSDNGNLLVDASFGRIGDPGTLHAAIRRIPGVLDSGLFLGMAERILIEGREDLVPARGESSS